jgi:hypothetical protein
VLADVQHQQRLTVGQGIEHRLLDRPAVTLADAERSGNRGSDHRRIANGHQIDEPPTFCKPPADVRRHGQGEPRLAHPAGPDGSDLPVRLKGCRQRRPLLYPAHEGGERR